MIRLPEFLSKIIHKPRHVREVYLALSIAPYSVIGAAWELSPVGEVIILGTTAEHFSTDDWQIRMTAADQVVTRLEELSGAVGMKKTVLGLDRAYVTDVGAIRREIQSPLKQLVTALDLEAIGFVPVPVAILFYLRKKEGIPTSGVFIRSNRATTDVTLVSVGQVIGMKEFPTTETIMKDIETSIKAIGKSEILPSRIVMYGLPASELDDVRATVMRHPWTTRLQFLHFPKIDSFGDTDVVAAVVAAGASELSKELPAVEEDGQTEEIPNEEPQKGNESIYTAVATAVEPILPDEADLDSQQQPEEEIEQTEESHPVLDIGDESGSDDVTIGELVETEEKKNPVQDESIENIVPTDRESETTLRSTHDLTARPEYTKPRIVTEPFTTEPLKIPGENEEETEETQTFGPEHDNVSVVDPSVLGFGQEGASEGAEDPSDTSEEEESEEEDEDEEKEPSQSLIGKLSGFFSSLTERFRSKSDGEPSTKPSPLKPILIGIIGLLGIGGIGYAWYWFVPSAVVTISVIPKQVAKTDTYLVKADTTVADPATKTIPGTTVEKTMTGTKTIAATGQKKIGDPGKGTVTIYNKTTSGKTLKKGAVFTSGALTFTLDGDVSIASASESIGSITFGKAVGQLTASAIGPEGNVPSSTEFGSKEFGAGVVSARNDQPFSGGSSKTVTVVSRSDYDAIVKALTADLMKQAQDALKSDTTSSKRLIESTVSTTPDVKKTFTKEIEEEAADVTGTITVTVKGIAVSETDISSLLKQAVSADVPAGYVLSEERTEVTLGTSTVKKNGDIQLTATLTATALPVMHEADIIAHAKGSDIPAIASYVKNLSGVASMAVKFSGTPFENTMPINQKNIKILVIVER